MTLFYRYIYHWNAFVDRKFGESSNQNWLKRQVAQQRSRTEAMADKISQIEKKKIGSINSLIDYFIEQCSIKVKTLNFVWQFISLSLSRLYNYYTIITFHSIPTIFYCPSNLIRNLARLQFSYHRSYHLIDIKHN